MCSSDLAPSVARIDSEHETEITKLRGASPALFDRTFMSAQVEGHEKALKLHQDYAKTGDNAELKKFAQSVAPVVQHHLEMAQKVTRDLNLRASAPEAK